MEASDGRAASGGPPIYSGGMASACPAGLLLGSRTCSWGPGGPQGPSPLLLLLLPWTTPTLSCPTCPNRQLALGSIHPCPPRTPTQAGPGSGRLHPCHRRDPSPASPPAHLTSLHETYLPSQCVPDLPGPMGTARPPGIRRGRGWRQRGSARRALAVAGPPLSHQQPGRDSALRCRRLLGPRGPVAPECC